MADLIKNVRKIVSENPQFKNVPKMLDLTPLYMNAFTSDKKSKSARCLFDLHKYVREMLQKERGIILIQKNAITDLMFFKPMVEANPNFDAKSMKDWSEHDDVFCLCFGQLLVVSKTELSLERNVVIFLEHWVIVNAAAKNENSVECPICLESMDFQDDVLQLRCGHLAHEECLKNMFMTDKSLFGMSNLSCPLCRTSLLDEGDLDHILELTATPTELM